MLPVKEKKLLDIGAGAGIFAELAAKNNWFVTAVDNAIDIDRFKNNHMVRAIKGKVEQLTKGELFDIVTLWDVIEHSTNPVELIHCAKQYIKNGGWIVIESGNYKSADRLAGGISHWIYQLDHRWYFSPESIELLLKSSGFSGFKFSDKVLRPDWNGSVNYKGPSSLHVLKSIIKDPLHLTRNLSQYYHLTKAKKWDYSSMGIFTIAARKHTDD